MLEQPIILDSSEYNGNGETELDDKKQ